MPNSTTLLQNFKVIRPRHEARQEQALDWLARMHSTFNPKSNLPQCSRRLKKFSCGSDKIAKRGTELEDWLKSDIHDMDFYSLSSTNEPLSAGISKRMEHFDRIVSERFAEFYAAESDPPAHIIHVTCTGYTSPSPAQKLICHKNWHQTTAVTHAYHMGCYASLPAVRIADALCTTGFSRVDLVHTEVCSFHFDPSLQAPEQLVVQSLFGDGHIRYSASSSDLGLAQPGFEVIRIREELISNSAADMTWVPQESGMRMTLSKNVPAKISHELQGFVGRLLQSADLDSRFYKCMTVAIHPGGPRIIDLIQDELQLSDSQIRHSKETLLNFGNMSSATLPHIWKSILDDPEVPSGEPVLSLVFGPGLTIFGALMRKRG